MSGSMVGAIPGTFIVVGIVVLGVILLGCRRLFPVLQEEHRLGRIATGSGQPDQPEKKAATVGRAATTLREQVPRLRPL